MKKIIDCQECGKEMIGLWSLTCEVCTKNNNKNNTKMRRVLCIVQPLPLILRLVEQVVQKIELFA